MKDTTRNNIIVLLVLVTCIFVGWVAPKKNTVDKCNARLDNIESYVNHKLLKKANNDVVDNLWNRVKKLEEAPNYYGEIQLLQFQVGELQRVNVFEKLENVDTVSARLDKLELTLESQWGIQTSDVSQLNTELQRIKKEVQELAKPEHSIIVKRGTIRERRICPSRPRLFPRFCR